MYKVLVLFRLESRLGKRLQRAWILDKWINILFTPRKYIMYEGRYAMSFLYYIIFLLHFDLSKILNFLFYLYKSLGHMEKRVQYNPKNINFCIYHHDLITILIIEDI